VQPVKLLATNVQIQLPPPPPPKGKLARGPAAADGDQPPGGKDPFEAGKSDGGEKPEGGRAEQVVIPGEIIKVN
jgi:hypothetical protein